MTKSCFKSEDELYSDYVKYGDPFFVKGLTFNQWKEAKQRITNQMKPKTNKYRGTH